ncbi:MAG: helix-turn-helix domain-containing protein [Candidatus Acidiferrales bacterium]
MERHKALLDNYPDPSEADGKLLKKLREDLQMGQVEISKLAGISQVAISRIESGVRPFSKRARNKIWPVIEKLYEERLEETKVRAKAELDALRARGNAEVDTFKAKLKGMTLAELESLQRKTKGTSNLLSLKIPTTAEESEAAFESYKAFCDSVSSSMTIAERLQFEKTLLETRVSLLNQQLAGKDAQIATLVKALDAAMREHPKKSDEAEATRRSVARLHREEGGN